MEKKFAKLLNLFSNKRPEKKNAEKSTPPSRKKRFTICVIRKYTFLVLGSSSSSSDISQIFRSWTKHHSDSPENDLAVQLLQKQIENYENEIELRRQRLLEEMKPSCDAVLGFGKKTKPALKDTDDALPYKPILFDINKVLADLKVKRAARQARASCQPILETDKPIVKTQSKRSPYPKSEKSMRSMKTIVGKSKQNPVTSSVSTKAPVAAAQTSQMKPDSVQTTAVKVQISEQPKVSVSTSPAVSHDTSTDLGSPQSNNYEHSSKSSSSSEDSSSSDKQRGFAGILMAMIEEAEKPPEAKPNEPEKKLTGVELAAISKNDPRKFDLLVLENTKQCLFVTQPTSEETRQWNDKRARPEMKQKYDELTFNPKQPLEYRKFCISCKPRYPVLN